jgi:hypothetical protein
VAPNEAPSRLATTSSALEQQVAIRSHRRAGASEPEVRAPAVVSPSPASLESPAAPRVVIADFTPPSAATVSQSAAPAQAPMALIRAGQVTAVQAVNGFFD